MSWLASSLPVSDCRFPIGVLPGFRLPDQSAINWKSAMVLFQSHRYPRILSIHLPVLAQQLFGFFGNYFRQDYLNFDKLIAVRVRIAQRRRAALPQAKLLP